MTSSTPRVPRTLPVLGLVRLGWAVVLLAAPAKVLDVWGGPTNHTSVTIARVLGVRHALQGTVEVITWPRWRRTGSFVDAAHSLTAAALAVIAPRWRRLGGADTLVAVTFAVGGWTEGPALKKQSRPISKSSSDSESLNDSSSR